MHLNLFGLYQSHDFDQVPSPPGTLPGTLKEEPGQGYHQGHHQDIMASRSHNEAAMMWEQAHRRNYIIMED